MHAVSRVNNSITLNDDSLTSNYALAVCRLGIKSGTLKPLMIAPAKESICQSTSSHIRLQADGEKHNSELAIGRVTPP